MKKNNIPLYIAEFLFALITLTACSLDDKPVLKWIIIIAVSIILFILTNMILGWLSIRFCYIYWPLCLIASLIIYFVFTNTVGDDSAPHLQAHIALQMFLLPKLDASIVNYSEVTYSFDSTFGEWRSSGERTWAETTPGFILKAVMIAILALGFSAIHCFAGRKWDWISLVIEGGWSLMFTVISLSSFIKRKRNGR